MLQRFSKDKLSRDQAGFLAVVLISVVFILIRLLMPIKFDGSFIDEYWHITSGISIFESGHYAQFYNYGSGYERGLLMSLWVGFWVSLFGKSILVAKLAPISIGIINYFLFLYLTIKLLDKRRFQLLLLVLYTLSPWVIFNHFYIRFYIMNELLLLVLLVLGYQLYKALRDEKWKSTALILSLVLFLNLFSMVAIKDQSEYMLLLATGVMLAGLFIYEFKAGVKSDHGLFAVITGNILLSNKIYRTAVVLVVAVVGFIVLDAGSKLEFLLHGTIAYTSLSDYKYSWLFWERNGVITAFFVLAAATFWWKSSGFVRIILPVAGLLFVIHLSASEDLQIVRGLLYFMPLYYLTAVIGVSKVFAIAKLKDPAAWLWYAVVSSIFLYLTLTNVTRGFYWGPNIKYEVNYIEYEKTYNALTNNCQGKLIIEAAPLSPFIARFYGVNVDYILSTVENLEQDELFLFDANTGKYNTVWGSVPVITDINELKPLATDICLVVRRPSMKRYLPVTVEEMLQNVDKSWHFHNMDLYSVEQEVLKG